MRHASIFLLLLGALSHAAPATAQDGRIQSMPDPVLITGRIVDEQGKPVPGVEIAAITGAMGKTLYGAHTHGNHTGDGDWKVTSDNKGEFVLGVPFEGIAYTLGARLGSGYDIQEQAVIAAHDGEPIELVAKPHQAMKPFGVLVKLPSGKPATDQPVTLVGEYGGRWVALTDQTGYALFDDVRVSHIGQAVVLVERDGLVAPLTIVRWRNQNEPTAVTLAEPATIAGRVVAQGTGEPIAGATVVLSPGYSSGLAWRVTTDADGRYRKAGLPPGAYQYRAVCATHADRPPRGQYWFEREIEVAPGAVADASGFQMFPRAVVRGRVVGPDGGPVAGALVGYPCHFGQGYDTTDAVFTDDAGRFELRPAPDRQTDKLLEAFHPIAGGASMRLESFEEGEVRDGIELKTLGTARVYGTVSDEAGEPVVGVRCSYWTSGQELHWRTDDNGEYDFGRVPIVKHRDGRLGLELVFIESPRPSMNTKVMVNRRMMQPKFDPGDRPVYVRATIRPEVGPDGGARADFTLQETGVLTFTGVLEDINGERVNRAGVFLFKGKINGRKRAQRKAIDRFIKQFEFKDAAFMRGGGDLLFGEVTDGDLQELVETSTDVDGTWTLQCLRTDHTPAKLRIFVFETAKPGQKLVSVPDLKWVTALAIWGDGDDRSYRLFEPVKIGPKQSLFTLPMDEAAEEE